MVKTLYLQDKLPELVKSIYKNLAKKTIISVRAQIPYHSSAEPNYLLLNGFSFLPLFYKV